MMININQSTLVQPAQEIPHQYMWTSNVDQMQFGFHTQSVYIYANPVGLSGFFDPKILKDALSKALVMFYPMAGRLRRNENRHIEIDCNGAGVLFAEGESGGSVADLGDFAPTPKLGKLVPEVDYSGGISSYPLLAVLVTRFKCGGVSLGIAMNHLVADGVSAMHFINTWCQIARGLDTSIPPLMDRSILCARNPPQPTFHSTECQPPPTMEPETFDPYSDTESSIFKLTRNQINSLKAKSKEDGSTKEYSTFELLAGHIWRCSCKARNLSNEQETKLRIATNGRSRLSPSIPVKYFGNVVFNTTSTAIAGDLQSKPTWYAASRVHDALEIMDNEYLKSVIDYWQIHMPNLEAFAPGPHMFNGANLNISSWARLPIHEMDFGWGRPIFVGPGKLPCDGVSTILPSPIDDGSLYVTIALKVEHMKLFAKYLYEI